MRHALRQFLAHANGRHEMTLRVFMARQGSDLARSFAYKDYKGVQFWECSGSLLCIVKISEDGTQQTFWVPMANIECFVELGESR